MSVDSDKLGTMVTGYNTLVPNLSASWDSITAEITDLYEQWSALDYAETEIEKDLTSYIESNKSDHLYTYGNFGVSGTGILNEWMGFDQETVTGLTRVDSYRVTVDGDQTSTFTAGLSGLFHYGLWFTASSTISASIYNHPTWPGDTLIGFNTGIVEVGVDQIFLANYAPWGAMWDSDTTVQGYMDDWVFLDDLMTKTLSSTGTYGIVDTIAKLGVAKALVGTYGIVDTIAKLGVAKALVLINMNKYNDATPILTTYAT
jgi:hypothetical protein